MRIHYSLEPEDGGTRVSRLLVLDVNMPTIVRPLRSAIISKFDRENVRTMAAVKEYADARGRLDTRDRVVARTLGGRTGQ